MRLKSLSLACHKEENIARGVIAKCAKREVQHLTSGQANQSRCVPPTQLLDRDLAQVLKVVKQEQQPSEITNYRKYFQCDFEHSSI